MSASQHVASAFLLCIITVIRARFRTAMPRISTPDATASFRVAVDRRVLDAFTAAMKRAEDAGLRVDYREDVEKLLKRLTRIVSDAATEAQPAGPAVDPAQSQASHEHGLA
jgi:hypothetical protein